MPPENIHNFLSSHIAFYRPIKRTYYLLKWVAGPRYWGYQSELNNVQARPVIIKYTSSMHQNGGIVQIKLRGSVDLTHIQCSGEYLMYGEMAIPIAARVGGIAIPANFMKYDFGGVIEPAVIIRYPVPLWELTPAPAPAPAPVPVLDPIPKRIAWLIAEDACKNNEICPITMDAISPMTAAVTTCFHCFDAAAIETWLINKNECPQCRKRCLATKAFDV